MFKDIDKAIKKCPVLTECIIGAAAVYLIFTMRDMLIFGEATLGHDNFAWSYPIFQFFAENIIHGQFPFWNPFSHAGEPFYSLILSIRLLEPVTLLVIYIGQFIADDIVMLFNWNRFIQSIMMAFGVYIVFRPLAKNLFIRLTLIPILFYSSFMLGSFWQDLIINQFMWAPFIAFFLLRIVYYKNYHWRNWIILGVFIGLNWQSYFFSGTWVFLLLFSSGILLFRRDLLIRLFKERMVVAKAAVTALIIIAMAAPNIILFLEKDKYVFPARMIDFSYEGMAPKGGPLQYEIGSSSAIDHGINMPYNLIAFTGTFSNIWDFIQVIAPDGNKHIRWPGREGWGRPSEAYMYIGLLPWAIALLGLVLGRHDLKRVWFLILLCFGLIMLGPPGGLHRLLYYTYPPMWFVRHTHAFVLFFVFALLYFYILGLNHIFSTWEDSLFPSTNNKQGILSRLITNNKICKGIAILIFSACIIISVYWMTKLVYPGTNYLFIFIFLVFIIGWFLRKDLKKDGLYVSLIVSHIMIVLILTTNTFKFFRYILPVLGLPLILFVIIKTRKDLSDSAKYYTTILLCVVFSIALGADLVYSLRKSSVLYKGTKHPEKIFNINTTQQPPFFPENRYIYPKDIITDDGKEQHLVSDGIYMGYLSFVYRESFVFSPIRYADYSDSNIEVKGILSEPINKSFFEDWVVSSKGNFVPKEFSYYQDGSGGSVKKYIRQDGVNDGRVSALLRPSSVGDSYLKYQNPQIEGLRDKHIRLSIWVKSQNKSPEAIQVSIQDNKSPKTIQSYNNSGNWEHLIVGKYINKEATELIIALNIKSTANMPAYFDKLNIEIVDIKTDTFEYALKSKRANSPFLLRKYFELINMDISPVVLEEIFAVGKPMFQFKKDVVSVKDSDVPALFRYLGAEKSIKLLHEAVIVDSQAEPSLAKPILASANIEKAMKAFAVPENFKGIENILDKKEKDNFTYSIEKYNYNSFTMRVAADSPGILYWSDGYDKGWRAYVDGKEVPIYRANINFKAINIPAGNSNISFTYKPLLFMIGLYIFYGVFIISILLVIAVPFMVFLYELFLKNAKQVQSKAVKFLSNIALKNKRI